MLGSGGIAPIFLTSALTGGEWSASCFFCFIPGEATAGTHWIEGWVGPRAGLNVIKERKKLLLPAIEPRPSVAIAI
jgi:hypothetical protein